MAASVLGVYALDLAAESGGDGVRMDTEPVYLFVMLRSDGTLAGQPLSSGGMPSGFVHDLAVEELADVYRPETGEVLSLLQRTAASLQSKMAVCNAADKSGIQPAEALSDAELQLAQGLLAVIGAEQVCPGGDLPEDEASNTPFGAEVRTGAVFSDLRLCPLLAALSGGEPLVSEHLKFITRHAISCRKKRQYERAIAYYHHALAMREDDHVLFNLARVYFDTEQFCEARKYLERALQLNPQLDMAVRFLEFLGAVENASCK